MPRTDLENLEKRRWASKYWRELPASTELEQLAQHELTHDVEARCLARTLQAGDAETIERELTAHRYLLIIREREQQRFRKVYPLLSSLLAVA